MSHRKRVLAGIFSQEMENSPKILRQKMDSSINTSMRNKFWLVFFALFVFWYLLLYGFDWSSLPGLSSISHAQENSIQSLFLKSIHVTGNREEHAPPNLNAGGDIIKSESKNTTGLLEEKEKPKEENEEPKNQSSREDDATQDVEGLEKELEPLLGDDSNVKNKKETKKPNPCTGRYIYVHDLPSRFNEDLVKDCKSLNKWNDMCQYLVNMGLGPDLGNPQRIFSSKGWFNTHQFSLEVIFHNKMKKYQCLTNDSSEAVAIFVPYYAGLDVARYLWDPFGVSVRDSDSLDLAKWLRGKPEWEVMGGRDHFVVAGRITWDFRRAVDDDSAWGNKLMLLPEFKNMTILTIESSPWNSNDFGIPYPTYFHPSSDNEVLQWQNKMRKQKRRNMFCFAGAPRPDMVDSIRSEIMDQCRASRRKCRLMECKNNSNKCQKPIYIMKMFQSSVFCLQPPGDSFTRRSTFDSILAGCIPVFFSPGSAYVQYLWHLPKDFGKYSVLIPEDEVRNNSVSIESKLSQIPKSKVAAMREAVIKLIPNVIYADPRSKLKKLEDAFDLAVKGVVERVKTVRKEISKGKNSSLSFDEEDSWKYYTFGTVDDHEWDHFFLRTDRSRHY